MKKIIVGFSLVAASSLCLAAATAITNNADGVASADLNKAACGVIATDATAKIRGSKDVRISYDCDTSAAGVGTAHPQGKGLSYGASSNGGALKKTDNGSGKFADDAAAGTAAGTAATAAKAAS